MWESCPAATAESDVAGGGVVRPPRALLSAWTQHQPTILIVEDHDHAHVPRRQPGRRRLRAAGGRLRAPTAQRLIGDQVPDLGDHRPRAAGPRRARAALRASATPIRSRGRLDPDLPLLILTGRASELDRLRGFERGCDDYLVKPFSYPRAPGPGGGAPAAHAAPAAGLRAGCGSARWSSIRWRARSGSTARRSSCPRRSSRCCARWPTSPTRVFTREELLRGVWGFQSLGQTRTLDSHASRLRKKLAAGSERSWSTCGESATG